jgi:hypothetical protein
VFFHNLFFFFFFSLNPPPRYLRNPGLIDAIRRMFGTAYDPKQTPSRALLGTVKVPLAELLRHVETAEGVLPRGKSELARRVSLYRFLNLMMFRFETCLRLKAGRNPFPDARGGGSGAAGGAAGGEGAAGDADARGIGERGEFVITPRELCVQAGIVSAFVVSVGVLLYASYRLYSTITMSKFDPLVFR